MSSHASPEQQSVAGRRRGRPVTSNSDVRKAQGLDRQRKRRARERIVNDENKKQEAARLVMLKDELGGKRTVNWATLENVEWITRVGCAPSAAGARSHLAGIISNVTCKAMNRWSVELYRWRMYVYIRAKDQERVDVSIAAGCYGVKLNFDETPTRMYDAVRKCVSSSGTQIRFVTFYGEGGRPHVCVPVLSRPLSGSAQDIFSALDLESVGLDNLARDSASWKFLLIVPDGARTNFVVGRMITETCSKHKRLLVIYAGCFAHILSNATKWSLGKKFGYGSYVRISHVLQARLLRDVRAVCDRRLPYVVNTDGPSADVRMGRCVWEFFSRRFFCVNGPVDGDKTKTKLVLCLDTCHSLWPGGLPEHDRCWEPAAGRAMDEYYDGVRVLFRRTVPTPVLSRWYSVESFAWYMLGCRSFQIFDAVLPSGVSLSYWPGENPIARMVDPSAHEAQSRRRMQRVLHFLASDEFVRATFAACVSSIPRWAFARLLFPSDVPTGGGPVGVVKAFKVFLENTTEILRGRQEVVEFLISREEDREQIRLRCYVALTRSVVYMAEKERAYASGFWRIIRGELEPSAILDVLGNPACCDAAGTIAKIRSGMAGLTGAARDVAFASLCDALRACSAAYLSSGGCDNMICESGFSILRALGLKLPYRPIMISTANRELVLRHIRQAHREWFASYVERAYGGIQNMRTALTKPLSNINGHSAFCRAMGVQFRDARTLWSGLPNALKEIWAGIARKMNATEAAMRRTQSRNPDGELECGPLGSSHRWLPVDVQDVYDRLNDSDGSLRARWTRAAVRDMKCRLDGQPARSEPAPDFINGVRGTLLSGDVCGPCRNVSTRAKCAVGNLFHVASNVFQESNGEEHGVVVGLVFEDTVIFCDLLLVMRNPRRLLYLPFRVLTWSPCNRFGLLQSPHSGHTPVPGAIGANSLCLIDRCVAEGSRLRSILAFRKIGSVVDAEHGWVYLLDDDFSCANISLEDRRGLRIPRQSEQPRTAPSGSFGMTDYMALFEVGVQAEQSAGQDISMEAQHGDDAEQSPVGSVNPQDDDQDSLFLGGSSSDCSAAVAMRVRHPVSVVPGDVVDEDRLTRAEQTLMYDDIRRVIDVARYAVAVRLREGVIVVYWRDVEKSRNWENYVRACRDVKKVRGCISLTSSKSSTLSKHGFDAALSRAQQWQQWHTAWLYRVAPSVVLPSYMKLPESDLAPGHPVGAVEIESASECPCSDESSMDMASDIPSSSEVSSTSIGTMFLDAEGD